MTYGTQYRKLLSSRGTHGMVYWIVLAVLAALVAASPWWWPWLVPWPAGRGDQIVAGAKG